MFGWEVPTSWFQSVNPLFIILLAPVISALWAKLATRKQGDLKIPTKMGLGTILLGIGYIILVIATLKQVVMNITLQKKQTYCLSSLRIFSIR